MVQAELAAISLVVRIMMALVFGAAAIGKARHLGAFTKTLLDLGLPSAAARFAVRFIIGYEALLAILLVTGISAFVAAMLAIGLLIAFVGVALVAHVSKRTVLCNCFGVGDSTLGLSTIARSGMLMVPAVVYIWLPPFDKAAPASPMQTSVLAAALTMGFILIAQWMLALPRLARLIASRRQPELFAGEHRQLQRGSRR